MNVTAQKFQSLYAPVGKSMAWRNHRTTLPQSRPLGVPAPSEREPGMGWCHSSGCSLISGGGGRFSSPLRRAGSIQRSTLPQSRPVGVPAPSEREPGWGLYHSTCRPESGGLRAIFIAPTKTQKPVPFTIQRGTLPQSASLTAPSEREPGWGLYHSMCRPESGRFRAIFIAPTKTQNISPVSAGGAIPGGAGHLRMGTSEKRN